MSRRICFRLDCVCDPDLREGIAMTVKIYAVKAMTCHSKSTLCFLQCRVTVKADFAFCNAMSQQKHTLLFA